MGRIVIVLLSVVLLGAIWERPQLRNQQPLVRAANTYVVCHTDRSSSRAGSVAMVSILQQCSASYERGYIDIGCQDINEWAKTACQPNKPNIKRDLEAPGGQCGYGIYHVTCSSP